MFLNTSDIKAAYTFFRHPEATPDNLQQAHREVVLEQMGKAGRYLLLEDTSEMTWPGNQPVPGLGPIGNGAEGLQGFHLHSVLALRWRWAADRTDGWPGRPAVEVLGLPVQHYRVRRTSSQGEPAHHSKVRNLARANPVVVEGWSSYRPGADRRAGRMDSRLRSRRGHLRTAGELQELDHRFVIRAAQDRCLTDEQGRAITGKLFATARAPAALGEFTLELRARPGQPARTAQLQVSAAGFRCERRNAQAKARATCRLCAARGAHLGTQSAAGGEPLEWILLTDWQVESYAQALEVALAYSTRWLIEEFHKALKTGNKAEELQLETAEALFAAIAIKSVVALRLLDLRERVRLAPDAPAAQAGLKELELKVLRQCLSRPIKTIAKWRWQSVVWVDI